MISPLANRSFAPRLTRRLAWSLALALLIGACNQPPAVNPWRDDSIPSEAWTTPSQDGLLAAVGDTVIVRQQPVPEVHAPRVPGDVPHYPLWWEDPFEDKGDQNTEFAWTWQDYVVMPYSFGRFLLNTMAWPVSAVVTPPGKAMVSDGKTGRDHDARPSHSPDPTAERTDFVYAETLEPIDIRPVAIEPTTNPAP